MAQSSIGFAGSTSDVQWAATASLVAQSPAIGKPGDCPITAVSGSRAVSIGTGRIGGDGVVTSIGSAEQVTIPAPTNGQWFLVVLTRTWATKTTAFNVRNADTTPAAAPTAPPAGYPASTLTNPGVSSDVPVAWVWASSSSTALLIVPLLFPTPRQYPKSGTATDRATWFTSSLPSSITVVTAAMFSKIAGEWFNTDTQCVDRYFGMQDASANPNGLKAGPADWYPVSGNLPQATLVSAAADAAQAIGTGTVSQVGVNTIDHSSNPNASATGNITAAPAVITIKVPGRYQVDGGVQFQSGGNAAARRVAVTKNSTTTIATGTAMCYDEADVSAGYVTLGRGREVVLASGDVMRLLAQQVSGATINMTRSADPRTFMSVRYLGPA